MVSIIAAIGRGRVLGKNNGLLWRIPADLKRFKMLTTGHPVIMGRKTYDSILATLGKPLPNRTNIIVTRNLSSVARLDLDVTMVGSIEKAIEKARSAEGGEEIFIIGGAQIYEQALPFTNKLYLTIIDDEKEGDAYFPAYETTFTKIIKEESGEYGGLKYMWVDLEK